MRITDPTARRPSTKPWFKKISLWFGLISFLAFGYVFSFWFGMVLRNPAFLSDPSLLPKAIWLHFHPPPPPKPPEFNKPEDYLKLLYLDPHGVPADKKSIADALNLNNNEVREAWGDTQRMAQTLNTTFAPQLRSLSDSTSYETVSSELARKQSICAGRSRYFRNLEKSVLGSLQEAGADKLLAEQIAGIFVERIGALNQADYLDAMAKTADARIQIVKLLGANKSKWRFKPDGSLWFDDKKLYDQFETLWHAAGEH
jgi:hypothetical protein